MTSLRSLIKAEIKAHGPINVARYMALALAHPEYGYYQKQDPFGVDGDFTTAPEVSQMFGEMIGFWCAHMWQTIGQPVPVNVVEFGPGRGTLQVDVLRAANSVPNFVDSLKLWLIETSPVLRKTQQKNLGPGPKAPCWVDSVSDVAKGPLLIIGNEFFDALPVHQYVRGAEGWRERLIDVSKDEDRLAFVEADSLVTEGLIPDTLPGNKIGDVYEDQRISQTIMQDIAGRIVDQGGVGIFIDYGHDRHGVGDTLQALKNHQFVDVLECPGDQDLTTHVDFEQLEKAAISAGAKTFGPIPQGLFLQQLGMHQRAEALKTDATVEQTLEINQAFNRLVNPEQMGSLFRVMIIAHPSVDLGF